MSKASEVVSLPLPSRSKFFTLLEEEVKTFPPAYFAMVMATGIVSIAANLLGMRSIAVSLFWINIVAYVLIWIFTLLRLILCTRQFLSDLIDHKKGPGFFTSVAGSCVLGAQFALLFQNYQAATILWVIGIILWLGVTYTIFTAFTVKENKPPLEEGLTGAWLLAVVSTQSIAVLAAIIATQLQQPHKMEVNFFALSMWLWGGMLYIWMISLIFYRYTFFKFSPSDLSPPYWINMGAMAISTLAGSVLVINTPDAPFIRSLLPFLKGFTVFYWATGTWWLPILLILGFWRHIYKKFPLRYDPLYWGAVFPLGMYTACTFQMARALELDFLFIIPRYFVYVALVAWSALFAGLVYQLMTKLILSMKKSVLVK
jgi:tellurite resistance protein TehA-like permease